MKKKQIIWISLLAVLTAFLIAHFGFHKEIWDKINSDIQKKESTIKGDNINRTCFVRESDSKKRIIVLVNNKDNIELTGGDITFIDGKTIDSFVFKGYKKDDLIDVFNDDKDVSKERVYKIVVDGIIEGKINKTNLNEIIGKDQTSYRIKNISKVLFDDNYIIPKINCEELIK